MFRTRIKTPALLARFARLTLATAMLVGGATLATAQDLNMKPGLCGEGNCGDGVVGRADFKSEVTRWLLIIWLLQLATRSCGGSSGRRRHSGVACGPVAPPCSLSIRSRPERALEGQTNPAVRLLPQRNLDLAFASLAENTTCCGLLKQPDNQKTTTRQTSRWCRR